MKTVERRVMIDSVQKINHETKSGKIGYTKITPGVYPIHHQQNVQSPNNVKNVALFARESKYVIR